MAAPRQQLEREVQREPALAGQEVGVVEVHVDVARERASRPARGHAQGVRGGQLEQALAVESVSQSGSSAARSGSSSGKYDGTKAMPVQSA